MGGSGVVPAGTSNSGPSSFGRCCGAVLGRRTGPGWMGGATSWASNNTAVRALSGIFILYEKSQKLCIHQGLSVKP